VVLPARRKQPRFVKSTKNFFSRPHPSSMQCCQMVYFQTKKSKFGKILAGPARCKMLVFFGHLGYVFYAQMLYFKTIWYILWPFGTLEPFWYVLPKKIWQLWSHSRTRLLYICTSSLVFPRRKKGFLFTRLMVQSK
jgi:hypothetical protein